MSSTTKAQYTVIRGQAYDVSDFVNKHPGGGQMLELGVGRDSTIMYESAHLRDAVADKVLDSLPKADLQELLKRGVTLDLGPEEGKFATPRASKLHNTIRKRVVEEVMKPLGKCVGAKGGRGIPEWHIPVMLATWLASVVWFMSAPCWTSAALMGMAMSWIGMGVQHTANHGGIAKNSTVNYILGLTDDVCVGGSSLVWRYHHQVSHHQYCNHVGLDQDVHSSFPLIRLDLEQELQGHHAYQHMYAFPMFSLLWFSVQWADLTNLIETCCYRVNFLGTPNKQVLLAFGLKLVHYGWLLCLPAVLHGATGLLFALFATMVGGFWTSLLFIVSHNLESCKPGYEMTPEASKDWARWQIETSASWGGSIACFFTGGLNLQIEHHLFPCLPHDTHPAVARIVKEECQRAGIAYSGYDTLGEIVTALVSFLKAMGRDDSGKAASTAQAIATAAGNVATGVAQTAKDMANSAAQAQHAMEKVQGAKDGEGAMTWYKPIFFVAVYQGLQEWYTSQWVQDNSEWQNTTAWKPTIMMCLYFSMIYFGTKFMENREPNPKLRKWMLTYNLYQVVLNAWCVYGLIREAVLYHDHPFNFTVEQSSYKLSFLIWVHYNNKFIELLDTTFMVFNKKKEQVSFLHVYHHVLIMWSWWAVCKWGCGGIAWFSAMLNSAIHVAMYGYYTLAALKLPCPWKKMLTMMQMGQFCFCMTSALYAMAAGLYPFYLSVLNIWVMVNMLVLFGQFYKKRYANKPSTELKQADAAVAKKVQ